MESTKSTTVTATTPSKYVRDFESLFIPIKVEQLRDKARNGNLAHCQFRSICWRYFLHCLPEQYDDWLSDCKKSRSSYEQSKKKHYLALEQFNEKSQSEQSSSPQTTSPSPTNNDDTISASIENDGDVYKSNSNKLNKELEEERQYLKAANSCDHRNVLKTIERDVVRTFPDMEFFRQSEMQGILERILFNFASENQHISYKQGMHELLATLLYVLHTDSQNCLINYEGGYANDTIATLLDLKYLEHDTYQLFCSLMKSVETWYQNDEILIAESSNRHHNGLGMSGNKASLSSRHQQVSSVLGIKLKMISESIVKSFDSELFNHLEALQIAPQIYGIRWMRLLFGREFEFLDLLTIWDAIICDSASMSLTNYIFASMLITIREELVNGDYTDCLNNLMRHQFKDVQYVIKLALHLRNPRLHPRPKVLHKPGLRKNFSQSMQQQNQHHNQQQHNAKKYSSLTPEVSLTSRLSQQYISVKQQFQQANSRYEQWSGSSSNSSHTKGIMQKKQQPPQKSKQQSQQQQYHHQSMNQMVPLGGATKEYEMHEMQSASTSATDSLYRGANKIPLASASKNNLSNMSTESYEDLHSIVDYCWRLLSEQIDSLQKCLPKEKSLHSEDEIFVALAQLKKVRDVLKGSLRLEDELEPSSSDGKNSDRK